MIERSQYLEKIEGFLDTPLIKVLAGMRRSGKSVLLKQIGCRLTERGVPVENILYYNFETLDLEHMKDYKALHKEVKERSAKVKGRIYLLLDEIQEVDSWEKAVNSFRVDMDCDIVITGSTARLLSGELATLLTGRYVEIPVYPLSFSEHLQFRGNAVNSSGKKKTVKEAFEEYMWLGSLPGIHELSENEEVIRTYTKDIFYSILLKDVIKRNNIRNTELLDRIIRFLLDNLGHIFSAKSIADFLKSQRRSLGIETVYNYLSALEDAHLIHKVSRFDILGKRHLETMEKYFIADHGIKHAVLGFDAKEAPGLLENIAYMELLRRGYSVSIGKQGSSEIDFIAEKRETRRYIQVCYLLADDNITNREFAPLLAVQDNHYKAVLSLDETPPSNYKGINRVNIAKFLLDTTW